MESCKFVYGKFFVKVSESGVPSFQDVTPQGVNKKIILNNAGTERQECEEHVLKEQYHF